jgi:hypothetical protein
MQDPTAAWNVGTALTDRRLPDHYKWYVLAMLGVFFFNYADRQAIFSVFPCCRSRRLRSRRRKAWDTKGISGFLNQPDLADVQAPAVAGQTRLA